MKFFLINPDYMEYGDPPLGLAYLATYLRKNCNFLDIRILDQLSENDIIKKIIREKPDILGFTAVSQNYYKVKLFAEKIKKLYPNCLSIIGGVHISTMPESFLNSPFDMAIRGEGEIPALQLINLLKEDKNPDLKKLSKIQGILFREKNKIIDTGLSKSISNLDEIPLPARDLLNMKYYLLPRFSSDEGIEPVGSLLTSRGCPYNCKFCSSSAFWKRNLRFFSAERVAQEIKLLYSEYGYKEIYIYDDLFSINRDRLKKLISLLEIEDILGKIKFSVYGRANCFDEEMAELLKKLGVKNIVFGFETGSQRLLTYLKGNNVTIQNNINAIKISLKYALNPEGFFMIGSPTETLKEIRETCEFIKKYCSNNFIIYQAIPFPGTEFWSYALKNKIINEDFYEIKQKEFIELNEEILLSESISKEDFVKYFKEIRSLHTQTNKENFLKKFSRIRSKHIRLFLSLEFIKKVNSLKSQFLKRIF